MGVTGPRLSGNLFASLAVAAFVAAVGLGLPAVNRSIPGLRALPAGGPYLVGAGVLVVPPPGARLDAGLSRARADRGTAVFQLADVTLSVVVTPYTRSLDEASGRMRQKIAGRPGFRVLGEELGTVAGDRLPGRQGRYTGDGQSGRYAVFVIDRVAVDVTARGPADDLARVGPAIDASIASVTRRSR